MQKKKKGKPRGKPVTKANAKEIGAKTSGNKKPKYDREELATRKIDNGIITRYLTINSHLTIEELQTRLETERITSLEMYAIRALMNMAFSGDEGTVLDRLVGPIPKHVIVDKPDPFAGKSLDELLDMKRQLVIENRKTLEWIEKERSMNGPRQDSVIDVTPNKELPDRNGTGQTT